MSCVECWLTWRIDLGISQHVLPLVELLIMLPDQLILALLKYKIIIGKVEVSKT